ncbi:MAG: hypothetical protein AAFU71_07955 [Cyanobacteria bacterium J06632_22]
MAFSTRAIALLLAVGLVSCTSSTPPSETAPAAPDTATTETEPSDAPDKAAPPAAAPTAPDAKNPAPKDDSAAAPAAPSLSPGRYCYFSEDDVNTLNARLTVDANQQVTGNFQGTIADEANSYYTSYRQNLDGTIAGSNLNLSITTWIEYDRQTSQETWGVSTAELRTKGQTLQEADCATVDTAFQNTVGQDAQDLTSGYDNVRTASLQFAPGEYGTTVSDAVVRKEAFVYTLGAQGGQRMSLNISSLEDNAAFDVVSPSGIVMEREDAFDAEFILPETGTYKVIVSGTRGNATYDLTVEIE